MNKLLPIDPSLIKDNPFQLIGTDWMLLTAGSLKSFNTMTASYGALGELWHKKIAYCFVRPQRYTYEFMEKNTCFTMSFFDESYRDVLKLCGTKSGRNIDKMKGIGLTPVEGHCGSVYFDEARLVLECRKIYYQDIDPTKFVDPNIQSEYTNDYHRAYIGEIVRALSRKQMD
ncbi:MAG: flavin reductase [Candidatus Zixiibacteriota bacterium]